MSQKFVPLISCTIIFDQNLFLHEISRRCLFLYREHIFRISVTGMPFLLLLFFFITFCSRCGISWCGTRRVDPQMIHFELFYHLVHRNQLNPKQYLFTFRSWKKKFGGIHLRKIITAVPFYSKAFVLPQKFETCWALLDRLSRGFFLVLPSQGPPILNIRSLFTNPCWTWHAYVRASWSSLLFCI